MMFVAVFIACAFTIAFTAVMYELEIKKGKEQREKIMEDYGKLIKSSEKLLFDYKVLIEVLKDNYTEEEINKMFKEKKLVAMALQLVNQKGDN